MTGEHEGSELMDNWGGLDVEMRETGEVRDIRKRLASTKLAERQDEEMEWE